MRTWHLAMGYLYDREKYFLLSASTLCFGSGYEKIDDRLMINKKAIQETVSLCWLFMKYIVCTRGTHFKCNCHRFYCVGDHCPGLALHYISNV